MQSRQLAYRPVTAYTADRPILVNGYDINSGLYPVLNYKPANAQYPYIYVPIAEFSKVGANVAWDEAKQLLTVTTDYYQIKSQYEYLQLAFEEAMANLPKNWAIILELTEENERLKAQLMQKQSRQLAYRPVTAYTADRPVLVNGYDINTGLYPVLNYKPEGAQYPYIYVPIAEFSRVGAKVVWDEKLQLLTVVTDYYDTKAEFYEFAHENLIVINTYMRTEGEIQRLWEENAKLKAQLEQM